MKQLLSALIFLVCVANTNAQVTWKKGTSDIFKISFEYPANWSYEETQDGVATEGLLLGNDNNKAGFSFVMYKMPEGFNETSLKLAGETFLNSMTSSGEFTLVDTLTESKVADKKALTFSLTSKSEGSIMFVVMYVFVHNDQLGMLMFGDDQKEYKASYTKYFEHMFSTVKLD